MATRDENPLLGAELPIPFPAVRAEHVQPAVAVLLEEARKNLAELSKPGAPRSFEGTLARLDALTERLDRAVGIAGHLEAVATTPELRAAYNAIQPEVTEFHSGIALDDDVFRALKEFAAT